MLLKAVILMFNQQMMDWIWQNIFMQYSVSNGNEGHLLEFKEIHVHYATFCCMKSHK